MYILGPPLVRHVIFMTAFLYLSDARPSYHITALNIILPGVNTSLAVHLFGTNYSEATVTAEILGQDGILLVNASKIFSRDTIGLLTLPPLPKNSSSSISYNLNIRGMQQNISLFSSTLWLRLAPVYVFIETDKVTYKPGQAVKIRTISTFHDKSPYNGNVALVVRDPENNIVQQFQNLTSYLGVVSTEFVLSINPMLGNWSIEATADNTQSSAIFNVTNGDLPEFDVTINSSNIYIPTQQLNLTGTIMAKSFLGKLINGSVTVSLKPFYYYYDDYYYYYYNTYTPLNKTYKIVSGSANFSFTYKEMGYNNSNWYSHWSTTGVLVNALVTDELTGTVVNASSHIRVTDSVYNLTMIGEPQVPAFGFNYTAKLQILRIDDATLAKEDRNNITIQIYQYRYYWYEKIMDNSMSPTTLNSEANLTSSNTMSSTPAFTASVSSSSTSPLSNFTTLVSTTSFSNISFSTSSISNSSIYTTPISTTSISNSNLLTEKVYTIPESGIISFEFPIMIKSGYIQITALYQNIVRYWYLDLYYNYHNCNILKMRISNSTKKVGEAFQVKVNSRVEVKELYYVVMGKGVVAAGKKTNALFTLTPEHSWAPSATLIVYALDTNCTYYNIVKTSEIIYIEGSFNNTVSLSWSKSKVQPGENVSLTINVGKTQSLVGLRVVEKTLQENKNALTASRVKSGMTSYYQGISLSDSSVLNINYPFDELQGYPNSPLKQPESVRTVYPETWLWQETNVSSSSTSLQVTAPQTNSTWVASGFLISDELGLGFTEKPIELAVSRPFFISLNLPYSVTRGEQFILEVTVFNYLPEKLQATVALEASNAFTVLAPANDVSTVAGQTYVIVPGLKQKTVFFPIKPKTLGQITIKVKATSSLGEDTVSKTIFVKVEGVKHFYSQAAVFQVNGAGGTSQTVSKDFSFTFPSDVVQDSKEALVTVIGDLLGPSIDGLESLIQMPYGCGEQNMINFAPNIYVLEYLTATGQIKGDIKKTAIDYMTQGYQRELTYKRSDGSFSAFGNGDSSGSTWLSAFVLRCFLQARPFIFISPAVLDQTIQWLVRYQDINTGIFSEPGRVIHSELQGGLNGPVTLTAYILTSLLEDKDYKTMYASKINKAIQYLESKFDEGISSNYTLSIVAYALSLANSTKANATLTQLISRAKRNGDMLYWSSLSETSNYWQPRSSDIETSAYALLSHAIQNRISEGIPIMKWISQQRSHLGGYSSTQDTIMALQALAQFVALAPNGDTSLTVKITGTGAFVPKTFKITSENLLVLQSDQITVTEPMSISVSAVGRGIAIFQLNINYNQKASSRRKRNALISEAFTLDVTVNDDKNDLQRLSVDVCTSYQGAGNESGMALLDVGYLSGFTLDPKGIPIEGSLKMVEKKDDKVYLYYDSVNKTQLCISVPMVRTANVAGSQDSVITILEYYDTSNTATRTYNSETMKSISSCDFCGINCSLCTSNVKVETPTTQVTSLTTATTTTTTPSSAITLLFHFSGFLMLGIFYII
ncbi:CD109 antigen-like [Pelobates fuscus]|uniref:CD109 antigen-like n=1 Tax=Pelobates fuscus TaxID=191477 RepID=UPI002FE4C5CF